MDALVLTMDITGFMGFNGFPGFRILRFFWIFWILLVFWVLQPVGKVTLDPLPPIIWWSRALAPLPQIGEDHSKISTVVITGDPPPQNSCRHRDIAPLPPQVPTSVLKNSTGSSAPKIFFGSMHHTLTCSFRSKYRRLRCTLDKKQHSTSHSG